MKHFVQYHNPDRIIPTKHIPEEGFYWIITRKKLGDLQGNCIWLIDGEGIPRTYFLMNIFIAERVERLVDPYFRYRIVGRNGRLFQPPVELTDYPWFKELKSFLGNFSIGLTKIPPIYFNHLIHISQARFPDFFLAEEKD